MICVWNDLKSGFCVAQFWRFPSMFVFFWNGGILLFSWFLAAFYMVLFLVSYVRCCLCFFSSFLFRVLCLDGFGAQSGGWSLCILMQIPDIIILVWPLLQLQFLVSTYWRTRFSCYRELELG